MYIGHSALRMYVMGRRAFTEKATEDEMVAHGRRPCRRRCKAGAIGFSSSRASTHVTPDDTPVASRIAEWEEIDRILAAMAELDAGIFQVGPDIAQRRDASRLPRHGCARWRWPTSDRSCSACWPPSRARTRRGWTYQTRYIDDTVAAGGRMFGQGTTRSINAIFSLKSYLPFDVLPAWRRSAPCRWTSRRGGCAIPRCAARWSRPRRAMKPRDKVFQGGGAATTDPRKPDYANLFAMNGVDWDDPTVEQLAQAAASIRSR